MPLPPRMRALRYLHRLLLARQRSGCGGNTRAREGTGWACCTKPPPKVGRVNSLQARRAVGTGRGREVGAGPGVGGGGGCLRWPGQEGGGKGGGKSAATDLLVPNGGPAHGLHPRFLVP